MEQNIHKCSETVRKVNDKLIDLGYNILYNSTYDNILCKTSDVTAESIAELNKNNSDNDEAQVYIIRKKCSMLNTGTCTSTIAGGTCIQTGCKLPSTHCPMYNQNQNTGNNTAGNGNNTGNNSTNSSGENNDNEDGLLDTLHCNNYLIRIRPTDTYNGIFLHAIMLNNETCDLKMTFDYGSQGVRDVVDTVIFLTT